MEVWKISSPDTKRSVKGEKELIDFTTEAVEIHCECGYEAIGVIDIENHMKKAHGEKNK